MPGRWTTIDSDVLRSAQWHPHTRGANQDTEDMWDGSYAVHRGDGSGGADPDLDPVRSASHTPPMQPGALPRTSVQALMLIDVATVCVVADHPGPGPDGPRPDQDTPALLDHVRDRVLARRDRPTGGGTLALTPWSTSFTASEDSGSRQPPHPLSKPPPVGA
jgi:hypothetical protein